MNFADPKSNIAFKKIFGNETKKEILISFLNAVLKLEGLSKIADVRIMDPYQAPKLSDLKETILDVRAKDEGGSTFIVEMQVEKQDHFKKRALYYTAKTYVSQIEKGIEYKKLRPVVFIGILDFKILENEEYLSNHLILDKKTKKQEIKDFEFNFIELPKFNKKEEELENVIEKWIYFLKNAEDIEIIPKELKEIKEIEEAFEIANKHTWTKKELEVYEYWELEEAGHIDAIETAKREGEERGIEKGIEKGIERGIERGMEKGKKEGMEQEKLKTAKVMKEKGIEIKMISEITGLEEEEIKKV